MNQENNDKNDKNAYVDRKATFVAALKPFVKKAFDIHFHEHRIRLNLFAMQIEAWKHWMIKYYSNIARYTFISNSTKYGCDEATLAEHVILMNISKTYAQHSIVKTNTYSDDISDFALRFQLDCINFILRYLFVNAIEKAKQYELKAKQVFQSVTRMTNQSWIGASVVKRNVSSTGLKEECYDHFLSLKYQTKLLKFRIWIENVYHNSGFSQNDTLISNVVSIWKGVPDTITKWVSIVMNIDKIYGSQIEIKTKISSNFTHTINLARSKPSQACQKKKSKCTCSCEIM